MASAIITTYNGHHVDVLNFEEGDVDLLDIAHALSNICRFRGHCKEFYSVAQHSFYVSCLTPYSEAVAGLMHDSPETYLFDLITPIKATVPAYQEAEDNIAAKIAMAIGLPVTAFSMPMVKEADTLALTLEAGALLNDPSAIYAKHGKPDTNIYNLDSNFYPWPPKVARDRFMWRFRQLLEAANTGTRH